MYKQIPNVVFDWLEQSAFSNLDTDSQQEVLKHMSREEYEELYESIRAIRAVKSAEERREEKREELLRAFDRKHRKTFYLPSGLIWKAAAVLLLCVSGWQFYQSDRLSAELRAIKSGGSDTVYTASNPERVVHERVDTVYMIKEERPFTTRKTAKREAPLQTRLSESGPMPGMNILSLEEFESRPNSPKGNSLSEDSLVGQFGFVTM